MQIVLDQPFLMGVHVLWESQLEYHIYHNDWEEVSKLLDVIPASVLSDGSLHIALNGSQPASTIASNSEFPDYGNYICSIEELDAVYVDVPDIKMFRLSANVMCSVWLRRLMEQELARKFIFLKEYWEDTAEIVTLLARSGFITSRNIISSDDDSIDTLSDIVGRSSVGTIQASHKLLTHHCVQQNLPNLLDLYLDYHKLVLDSNSLQSLQEAAVSFHFYCPCLSHFVLFVIATCFAKVLYGTTYTVHYLYTVTSSIHEYFLYKSNIFCFLTFHCFVGHICSGRLSLGKVVTLI